MLKLNKNYRNLSTCVYKKQPTGRLTFDPIILKGMTRIMAEPKHQTEDEPTAFDVIDELYEKERVNCKTILDTGLFICKC